MPDSPTDCGEPVALSKIFRLPVSAVVSSTGVKMTETLHFLPGASVLSHCDFTVKTDGDAVSIVDAHCGADFLLAVILDRDALGLARFSDCGLVTEIQRRRTD